MPIPNIGPRGQRRRFLTGVGFLLVSVAVFVWLIRTGKPPAYRAILLLPLWGAGLGFFQAKEKT
jgi:hypothetical protein